MENWALSVDHSQLYVVQFSVHHIDLLSILFRGNGFTRIQKAVVDQMGSRPPNSDRNHFGEQVWLWEVLWSFFLVQPLSWSCGSYIVHFSLHVTIRLRNGSLLHRKKDDTSKWQFFWFAISSWGTHLSSIFTFPICFNCQKTIGWLTLSSWATSHAVVRG